MSQTVQAVRARVVKKLEEVVAASSFAELVSLHTSAAGSSEEVIAVTTGVALLSGTRDGALLWVSPAFRALSPDEQDALCRSLKPLAEKIATKAEAAAEEVVTEVENESKQKAAEWLYSSKLDARAAEAALGGSAETGYRFALSVDVRCSYTNDEGRQVEMEGDDEGPRYRQAKDYALGVGGANELVVTHGTAKLSATWYLDAGYAFSCNQEAYEFEYDMFGGENGFRQTSSEATLLITADWPPGTEAPGGIYTYKDLNLDRRFGKALETQLLDDVGRWIAAWDAAAPPGAPPGKPAKELRKHIRKLLKAAWEGWYELETVHAAVDDSENTSYGDPWTSIIDCLFNCGADFHEDKEDSVEPEESDDDDPDGGSEGSGEDDDEEEPDSKKSKLDH